MENICLDGIKFSCAEDEAGRQEFQKLLEDTLEDARELGLKVEISAGKSQGGARSPYFIKVHAAPPLESEKLNAFSRRDPSQQLQEPISAGAMANLIQFRHTQEFMVGMNQLAMRIIALGWQASINSRDEYEIRVDKNTRYSWKRNPEELPGIINFIEATEQTKRVLQYENDGLFKKAGISVTVSNGSMEIVLKENDPALKRQLTPENVQWLIDATNWGK